MDKLVNLFNQEINSANVSWWLFFISFLGGVISSLSPCTLGILPIIIGYIAGYSKKNAFKTFVQMSFFIIGMAIVLTSLGLICAISGKILLNKYAEIFALIVNGIIFIMGLNLLGLLEFHLPVVIKEMPQNRSNDLVFYPLLIGCLFALATTPCSTPILAGIMGFASLSANIVIAGLMLFLFAIGQGVVIVIAAVFTSLLKGLRSISKVSTILMKLSGLLLIGVSTYLYWKIFSPYIQW